jgi:hypothetical protein
LYIAVADRGERRHIDRMKRRTSRRPDIMDPKVLMGYDRWVKRHFDELVRKHPGKFIAVSRNRLVAIGDSLKEVSAAAEKRGTKGPALTMQVPAIEDLTAIL